MSPLSSRVAVLRRPPTDKPDQDRPDEDGSSPDVVDAPQGAATGKDSALHVESGRGRWSRVTTYTVLSAVMLGFAVGAGWLKFYVGTAQDFSQAAADSVRTASESAVAMLSYKAATVERDLAAATDRLTGDFRTQYVSLTHEVVIPGAKQQQISSTASVPAAASISATSSHAEVLVFVNQTVTMGHSAPTDTASTVKVGMDRVGDRWLISRFDPI